MLIPQDGAGHFIDTGPWSFLSTAFVCSLTKPFLSWSSLWRSALAACMGIHKEVGIPHVLDNIFLFYTSLKASLVLLCSCASQDAFVAGQQSFCPSMEKLSRLIVFSKVLCWSQQPRMETWQLNAISMAIMILFCFEREKNPKKHTSRSYIIS